MMKEQQRDANAAARSWRRLRGRLCAASLDSLRFTRESALPPLPFLSGPMLLARVGCVARESGVRRGIIKPPGNRLCLNPDDFDPGRPKDRGGLDDCGKRRGRNDDRRARAAPPPPPRDQPSHSTPSISVIPRSENVLGIHAEYLDGSGGVRATGARWRDGVKWPVTGVQINRAHHPPKKRPPPPPPRARSLPLSSSPS